MAFPMERLLLMLALITSVAASMLDTQTYVVHMDTTKVPKSGTKKWHEVVFDSILELSADENQEQTTQPELLYIYETTLSGFAARLSYGQAQALHRIDGFLSLNIDTMLTLHTTHSPQFLGLETGKGLWNKPVLASDVIVGIIDTGIWPEHPSFADARLSPVPAKWKGTCESGTMFSPTNCNKKIIGARAFWKGYEAAAGKINATIEYRSPRDAEGHGTHTASTVAGSLVAGADLFGNAKGNAGGMINTARIAAYKVCWSAGCASSDILAAIDQAVADGVDILSLSLGGTSRPYHSDNLAIAAFGAVQKGVFVSCSAGNSGPWPGTVSNTAPWLMTVAASSQDRTFPTMVKLGDGHVLYGASLYYGKPTKFAHLVYGDKAGGQGAEYCSDGSLSPTLVKGKIVICDRGMNSRTQKGEQVKKAGGLGMLVLNTEGQGEELIADAHVLPASSLGANAGKSIKVYAKTSKNPTAMIVFQGTVYGSTAPIMTAFSSRGPSLIGPDIIKPDVTAPGMNILAAWPLNLSPTHLESDKRRVRFNIVSGTSMSCPHVSGLAALLKSAHRDWSPAAIKSALMTTSYVLDNKKMPIGDASTGSRFATPFAFGSGHVDPERASNPGLVYDISKNDYLDYLCSLNYSSSEMGVLVSEGYACPSDRVLQAGDLNYPSFSVIFDSNVGNSSFTFVRTVTNVGLSSSKYRVQISQPEGVLVNVEPSLLVFRKSGEKVSYKVTFVKVGGKALSTSATFGALVWVNGGIHVRSPIAVTWQ